MSVISGSGSPPRPHRIILRLSRRREKFSMTPEQSFVFADQASPFYLAPAFGAAAAFQHNMPQVKDAFRTGEGVPWGDQSQCLSCAVARFFRPGYTTICPSWLPALDGVVENSSKVARSPTWDAVTASPR